MHHLFWKEGNVLVMKEQTYEDSMKELEQVVKELESGELSLDESIKKFEKGMELSKHCSSLLEDAEKKITLLIERENGEIVEEPFEIEKE